MERLEPFMIIFRKQTKTLFGLRVWKNMVHTVCKRRVGHDRFRLLRFGVARGTSLRQRLKLQHMSAGIPSNLRPASNDSMSASVLLCHTAVCFLQVHLVGANVSVPKMHNILLHEDMESFKSRAKSASWKVPNLHSEAEFPT